MVRRIISRPPTEALDQDVSFGDVLGSAVGGVFSGAEAILEGVKARTSRPLEPPRVARVPLEKGIMTRIFLLGQDPIF